MYFIGPILDPNWHVSTTMSSSYGYGSIPMKIPFLVGYSHHKSQLFWCEQKGYYWYWSIAIFHLSNGTSSHHGRRSSLKNGSSHDTQWKRVRFEPLNLAYKIKYKPPASFQWTPPKKKGLFNGCSTVVPFSRQTLFISSWVVNMWGWVKPYPPGEHQNSW